MLTCREALSSSLRSSRERTTCFFGSIPVEGCSEEITIQSTLVSALVTRTQHKRLCGHSLMRLITSVGIVRLWPHTVIGIEPVSAVTVTAEFDSANSWTGKRRHPEREAGGECNVRRVLWEVRPTDWTQVLILGLYHIRARTAAEVNIRGTAATEEQSGAVRRVTERR